MRGPRSLVAGRLRSFVRAGARKGAGSAVSNDVSTGEAQTPVTTGRLLPGPAATRDTAVLLFGRDFSSAPPSWGRAQVCGPVTPRLRQHLSAENQELIALSPGWAEAVVRHYDCHFFVVETAALYRGVWFGALEPGGEHLLDEILTLVAAAREQLMTPLLIENHPGQDASGAASLTLSTPLERLRGALPARLSPDSLAPTTDPYAPAPSPLLHSLTCYAQQSGAP